MSRVSEPKGADPIRELVDAHKKLEEEPLHLAMSFEEGVSIEELANESPERRDELYARLIRLVTRELFEFGVMQTDPNFANYRYQTDTGRLVLLDVGARSQVKSETVAAYRAMLRAGLVGGAEAH